MFLAFATSDSTFIKLFGIGLALAVILDATVIRATLVPAFMRLAGEANWWAPAPLRRFHDRYGFSEADGMSKREIDAIFEGIDLTFLDLETERAIRRGDGRERERPLVAGRP